MLQIMRVLRANQHQSNAKRSKNSAFCENQVKAFEQPGEAGTVTKSRLHELRACMKPSSPGWRKVPWFRCSALTRPGACRF